MYVFFTYNTGYYSNFHVWFIGPTLSRESLSAAQCSAPNTAQTCPSRDTLILYFFGFFGGFTVSKADVVCPRQRGYPLRSPAISQAPSLVLNAIRFSCYSLGVASTPWLIWYCFQPII